VGNILARTSTIGEQAPQTTEYEYDGYNKLTGKTYPDSVVVMRKLNNQTKSW
jgi:YD repeat-containing protein